MMDSAEQPEPDPLHAAEAEAEEAPDSPDADEAGPFSAAPLHTLDDWGEPEAPPGPPWAQHRPPQGDNPDAAESAEAPQPPRGDGQFGRDREPSQEGGRHANPTWTYEQPGQAPPPGWGQDQHAVDWGDQQHVGPPWSGSPAGPGEQGQAERPPLHNPFLEQAHSVPHTGMRRLVYRATFGTLNLGPSPGEQAARVRRQRVRSQLHGSWRIVVMSIKGGVGKTTTAAMLGRTLAEWRGDRVVALDTNPDMGTLGDRLVGATDETVRGLLAHEARAPINQVAEVNRFTNLAGRLHVLANEQDPAVSEDFTGEEYQTTLGILERFYNVIIADCGTGVLRPWVREMLALANTLVVVAEPKGDAATRAAGTLDWIEQHGFRDLVARSVAVINYRSPTPKSLDVAALNSFFGQRCRAVRAIRYDEHLDLGVQIQYEPIPDAPSEAYVADTTKEDYLELAATIADEFR
ncbi:MAG: AAA family ATPase [Streptosporangiales bacterium]